ncbi:GNAT superfamily N-acetyltransferase [Nonomuraea muscovyensis]|uniref:GNAT superfamily N-acetyltransferase n=1 Tax=Nonomuraea muscovyensis TaxID=1124761 RepID=A0A7X0C544_9ACTN|nr:GNAT family N-acetyltransferase [Nonomuraea muscovyensis]MBB6346874.1 GNAT superfamily N-acetyltransferase [Nonomuraea muscovyensis]
MEHDEVLAAYDRQMRRDVRPDAPGVRVERAGAVVRQTAPATGWNGVLWSDLPETGAGEVEAAIARQVRHYAALGLAFEWKLYAHDRPRDLGRRLIAAGFTPEPAETLMVAETAAVVRATDRAAAPAEGSAGEGCLPGGVRLVPVTDAAGVELMAEVHEQAFGTGRDAIRHRLLALLAQEPGTVAAVVALAGGRPVSAARMELPPGTDFAGLWGGGTVPGHRGRGLYRALVGFRARLAAERGYRYLHVDASEQSRPILLRLGFAPLSTTTPYLFTP